jgi:hypothetical protein
VVQPLQPSVFEDVPATRWIPGFQAFDFLKFVFGVCDASQLAEWIEALTALKEPDALGEDIPV